MEHMKVIGFASNFLSCSTTLISPRKGALLSSLYVYFWGTICEQNFYEEAEIYMVVVFTWGWGGFLCLEGHLTVCADIVCLSKLRRRWYRHPVVRDQDAAGHPAMHRAPHRMTKSILKCQ